MDPSIVFAEVCQGKSFAGANALTTNEILSGQF